MIKQRVSRVLVVLVSLLSIVPTDAAIRPHLIRRHGYRDRSRERVAEVTLTFESGQNGQSDVMHVIRVPYWGGRTLLNYIEVAAQLSTLRFDLRYSPSAAGYYLLAIDGRHEDSRSSPAMFWALLSHSQDGSHCLLPSGISSYIPYAGERIVIRLTSANIFSELYTCT